MMKHKIAFLLVVFLILSSLLFLFYKIRTDKEQQKIEETRLYNRQQFVSDSLQKIKDLYLSEKRYEEEKEANKILQQNKLVEFRSNVNSFLSNSPNVIEVAVTIIDESNNVLSVISSDIASIYNQNGKKGTLGLLKSSFLKQSQFQELYDGNPSIISKLELARYTDYLAIGKLRSSIRNGTLVAGTIICDVSLTMSIISANSKNMKKSFNVTAIGNGVTESQARGDAFDKLLDLYKADYSSL